MYKYFIKYGKILFDQKLVNLHSGNLSVVDDEHIFITRTGSQLGDLTCKEIIKVNLSDDTKDAGASVETKVHRAIYLGCPEIKAVAHAHTPYATALSMKRDMIELSDTEGKLYIPKVPVLCCEETIGSQEVADNLPALISKYKIAVIKGHGTFSGGKDLEEATSNLMTLESSCQILLLLDLYK
jgi:L-fuculose-phosphate aldolase